MSFFALHKIKRERLLRKMAAMREAKERRRLERPAPEPEPRMVRTICLSLGLRDDLTGETAWCPLKSLRDAGRRIALVLREYQPGGRL